MRVTTGGAWVQLSQGYIGTLNFVVCSIRRTRQRSNIVCTAAVYVVVLLRFFFFIIYYFYATDCDTACPGKPRATATDGKTRPRVTTPFCGCCGDDEAVRAKRKWPWIRAALSGGDFIYSTLCIIFIRNMLDETIVTCVSLVLPVAHPRCHDMAICTSVRAFPRRAPFKTPTTTPPLHLIDHVSWNDWQKKITRYESCSNKKNPVCLGASFMITTRIITNIRNATDLYGGSTIFL